jgi:hypothetical protein
LPPKMVPHVILLGLLALDNGAVPRPFLGWSTWNLLGCAVNETIVKEMADAMVSSGLRDAGWRWIMLDDCWSKCEKKDPHNDNACVDISAARDAQGNILADPALFPSGMAATADHVHELGLSFGIYTSFGKLTCMGYAGSLGYEAQDAATFASWGVDLLKHDYCDSDPAGVVSRAPIMRDALNATGRTIAYYVDVGGSVPKVAGGRLHARSGSPRAHKTVHSFADLPWSWGPTTANVCSNQHHRPAHRPAVPPFHPSPGVCVSECAPPCGSPAPYLSLPPPPLFSDVEDMA